MKPKDTKKTSTPSRITPLQQAFGLYCLGYSWVIAAVASYIIYQDMSPFMLAVLYLMGLSFCVYGNIVWVKEVVSKRQDVANYNPENLRSAKRSPLIHLSVLVGYIIPFANLWLPTLIWFKNEKPLDVSSGLYVFNFQILISLFMMTACMLTVIAVGFIMMFFLIVVHIALTIIMAIVAATGRHDIYPFDLDLLRFKVANKE